MSDLVFPLTECLVQFSLAVTALRKGPQISDYNAMIAVMHCHLHAETHPGGEIVSTVK